MDLWLAHARLYVEKFGLSVIPMGLDKRPMIAWKEYQERHATQDDLEKWPHENLAIVTGFVSGIVVVDCESREDAEWFWKSRGTSPVICQTKRGFHFYFRWPGQQVKNAQRVGERYDVRGDGGYVLAPPSRHSKGRYRWIAPMIAPRRLPLFQMDWRPETKPESREREIMDGEAYISRIYATAGQGGHNATFRAAWMLRHSGLSEAEAFVVLQRWNRRNADPPWSDQDLLHKIKEVFSGR
jgi:hypothetical protein